MNDPKRLLDDTGLLTNEERQVLAAEAHFSAPPEARSRLWSELSAAIPTTAGGLTLSSAGGAASSATAGSQVAASSASVAHTLSLGAVVKLTLVGIGIGTSVATANHFWSAHEVNAPKHVTGAGRTSVPPAASAVSPPAVQAALLAQPLEPAAGHDAEHHGGSAVGATQFSEPVGAQATLHSSVADTPSPSTTTQDVRSFETSTGHAPASPGPAAEHLSPNTREESQLVGSARSMLRAGSAAVALQLVERAASRFPNGVLVQEREALRIEALAALGRRSEARALAEKFVRAYPNSPHVTRVRGQD